MFQQQLSPQELAQQEFLIQEREQEIREIEGGIHELAEIFTELGTIVATQGDLLGMCGSTLCRKPRFKTTHKTTLKSTYLQSPPIPLEQLNI
jgi:hypothetical protein